jgi:dipeptide/tripeptide permease
VLVVGRSSGALIAACALVGVTVPPSGAYARAVLTTALSDEPARMRSAYAADSALAEGALVFGPLLVAAAVTVGGTATAIVVAALTIELGTIAMTVTHVARDSPIGRARPEAAAGDAGQPPSDRAAIRVVLAATLCVTVALGILDVAVPIFAARRGSLANAGLLLGLLAAGTALGALWYGSREHGPLLERSLSVYTAPLVACIAGMALVTSPLLLGALLVVAGLAIGPLYVVLFALIQRSTAPQDRTRAFSWEVTVTNVGAALGSMVAGVVIAHASIHAALAVAAAAGAIGLAVGLTLWLSAGVEPAHNPAQG